MNIKNNKRLERLAKYLQSSGFHKEAEEIIKFSQFEESLGAPGGAWVGGEYRPPTTQQQPAQQSTTGGTFQGKMETCPCCGGSGKKEPEYA